MLLTEKTSEIKHTQLTPDGDSFRMKVPVLQADQPNLNRRVYPFAVVKAAVEDLKARLQKRSAFGSTRHEKDLEIDQISHTIEDISLDDKGEASAVLRILGTTKGKNLAAIIRGGGSLGISARGFGDIDEKGTVKPGYRLAGVDFTLDPSFSANRVGKECVMFESRSEEENDGAVSLDQLKEFGLTDTEEPKKELTEEDLKTRYYAAIQAGFKGDFTAYQAAMTKPAADIRAEIEYELAKKDSGFKGSLEVFRKTMKKG